ncbi:hypothetical protein LJR022_000137 [Paraburkholderia hospita]|uniref:hypothetical protein n=1 Tax=Paraburkholderia hospita TaxID=169430 RepID=UPI003ECC8F91
MNAPVGKLSVKLSDVNSAVIPVRVGASTAGHGFRHAIVRHYSSAVSKVLPTRIVAMLAVVFDLHANRFAAEL